MIERGASPKHTAHVCHRRGIPCGQRLVKRGTFCKHIAHVGHRRGIPCGQRLVKRGASGKHMAHIGDGRGVPGSNGFVAFIFGKVGKQLGHVGNQRGVPGSNVSMNADTILDIHDYRMSQLFRASRLKPTPLHTI